MSKSYKVMERTVNLGELKGKKVYNVRPVSYGTKTTDDAARQIAAESTSTPGDVKLVLDRYAYYVQESLRSGYDIELLGFGKMYLRFKTSKSVQEKDKANASLVKSLIPGFRPSFTKLHNGTRLYDLTPTKIELVKFGDESQNNDGGTTTDTETSGDGDSGSTTTGDGDSTGGESEGGFQG